MSFKEDYEELTKAHNQLKKKHKALKKEHEKFRIDSFEKYQRMETILCQRVHELEADKTLALGTLKEILKLKNTPDSFLARMTLEAMGEYDEA